MQSMNTAASGMAAQQNNLNVISNNLANVNTTGFKSQTAQFEDLMYQTVATAGVASSGTTAPPQNTQIGLGANLAGTESNFAQGSLTPTNNPLDLAINGSGFFKVMMPNGTFAFTRAGNFSVDSNNVLVTPDGYPLEPPITIPQNSNSISVSSQGVISVVDPSTGQTVALSPPIGISMFPNPGALQRIGQSLFSANNASGAEQDTTPGQNGAGTIAGGYLEGSNVQVVTEMVNMIMAQRAYEINSKAIQTSDEMMSTVTNLKR
jgi:flagellar basal-body rod protein FlgG